MDLENFQNKKVLVVVMISELEDQLFVENLAKELSENFRLEIEMGMFDIIAPGRF